MKKIGIITIHKIFNYGSVLQAFALQEVCKDLGYDVELIDYLFPNSFHVNNPYIESIDHKTSEPKWIKSLFLKALLRQHNGIRSFVSKYLQLSKVTYNSPDELEQNCPHYDIYITGSDQVWNPRFCNGDPSFMLHFAPDTAMKVSYAASFGTDFLPEELHTRYKELLSRYSHIAVREKTGINLIQRILNKESDLVLDPTLLLDKNNWNSIADKKRLIKHKYILCYFLNYSFDAFPFVDNLAREIQKQTGYKLVRVARPPHQLFLNKEKYRIGATPEEFLSLIRDAEIILTTSFHGTAFAVNYGKPVFTIVKDKESADSRQVSLMKSLGLEKQIISIHDSIPCYREASYDVKEEQEKLNVLRQYSMDFLKKSLNHEAN